MSWVASVLTKRLGVADGRASVIRITAWTVAWLVVVGVVVAPHRPVYTDRATPADDPPTENVRYVAPADKTDHAGFLAPPHDPETFTVAWVGGSDVKLGPVSLAGEVSRRVGSVGGKPLRFDVYNLVAARSLDAYLAVRSAMASKADALVISLNPVWSRGEWSVHDWPNLDVSNLGDLLRRHRLLRWLPSFVSPADVVWAGLRRLPLVRSKATANARAVREVDRLDLVTQPATPPAPVKPRVIVNATDFFLGRYFGGAVLVDSVRRMEALLQGFGLDDAGLTDLLLRLIVDAAETADRPVFLYLNPFSFDALADPSFGPVIEGVERDLATLGATIDSPKVMLEATSLSRRMTPGPLFIDVVHMRDAGPAAELLAGDLCRFWSRVDGGLRCGRTPVGEGK